MIPVAKPMMGPEEEEATLRVLRSGVIANGPESRAFEQEWADYLGAPESALVSNGTTALQAALMSLASRNPYQKDVLVPAMSFNATSAAVLAAGLNPVFVDIERYSHNISTPKAKELIRPRSTLGIIAVDLYGLPANYERLSELGLPIIQDAAQAHGALYGEWPMGHVEMQRAFNIYATTFSFYATKNITTGGEGGAVVSHDWEVMRDVRLMREHGQTERYIHDSLGYNWRVTELQAAIGRAQLKKLPDWQDIRFANASYLTRHLTFWFSPPHYAATGLTHGWHQYVVTVIPQFRGLILKYMGEHGVGTGIHYPVADPAQPMYGYPKGDYLNATYLAESAISLPVGPWVGHKELDIIAKTANEAYDWAMENWEGKS